ncbi:MAG TPA: cyclase family protein [bacterium]|nr:cyclase family protein [bacterium]
MAGSLIRYDLSLPGYFSYPPAPSVKTRPMIPRGERRSLYMRGEYGAKVEGEAFRPMTAHNTTHLDVPYHFDEDGDDLAAVLNRADSVADRPCLARVVSLARQPALPGAHTREGVTYCEAVSAAVLPSVADLRQVEALVVLTGFGALMARYGDRPFAHDDDGYYHVPWFTEDATAHILKAGLKLVAIDSTTVERQTSSEPHRMSGDVHMALLGHAPPVLIMECLDGSAMAQQVGFVPSVALLHMVPRRVNAEGADAAHSRAFLYFYRDDADGTALRSLQAAMTPQELYG